MLVIEVALALFTLITEFSAVRVRGSSWRGCNELKFFGNNFESSINSLERTSLTSFGGSSWTESKVRWDVEEFMLATVSLAPWTARELRLSWTAEGAVFALDGFTSRAAACDWDDEPAKAFTAAWAAAAAVCSMVSLIVAWMRDFTWVNWLSDSSLSSEGLRSSRSWTCCCSCSNCCWSSAWSPPFRTGGGTTLACGSACSFCRASFSLSISVERGPVAGRLSRLNKFLRSFT